ncbi:hypothetical protein NQ315_007256 [Exocentrus adspersus]|uniref:Uncharacterized protein n=1 Tax=Exocentrus adspersus TaxID=1586481 RepID=A0AAV8WCX1_9CUCU|nr:hypothetical protein NQ315_007256 [Exocentrus adspersus]
MDLKLLLGCQMRWIGTNNTVVKGEFLCVTDTVGVISSSELNKSNIWTGLVLTDPKGKSLKSQQTISSRLKSSAVTIGS